MKINILAFGIAKEIFGNSFTEVELNEGNVDVLKALLEEKFPRLKQIASYRIAVNDEFASAGMLISEQDEIAIIPPVSGG